MTKREQYEAYIATLPQQLSWRIDADAQDNAFPVGPAVDDNDERYSCALETARMMADDPAAFGLKAR